MNIIARYSQPISHSEINKPNFDSYLANTQVSTGHSTYKSKILQIIVQIAFSCIEIIQFK